MKLKDFPSQLTIKDLNFLKNFHCSWYHFIPYLGSLFLFLTYLKVMRNVSILCRRFVRSKRYLRFISPAVLTLGSFFIQWIVLWGLISVIIFLTTGGAFNFGDDVASITIALYVSLFLLLCILVIILLEFTPIFFRTQIEYAIAAVEITLSKVGQIPDLIVGIENADIE